jgi:hypothetical protein
LQLFTQKDDGNEEKNNELTKIQLLQLSRQGDGAKSSQHSGEIICTLESNEL